MDLWVLAGTTTARFFHRRHTPSGGPVSPPESTDMGLAVGRLDPAQLRRKNATKVSFY
jgi:hypothetical protein